MFWAMTVQAKWTPVLSARAMPTKRPSSRDIAGTRPEPAGKESSPMEDVRG
jgi:hypothetical protein